MGIWRPAAEHKTELGLILSAYVKDSMEFFEIAQRSVHPRDFV